MARRIGQWRHGAGQRGADAAGGAGAALVAGLVAHLMADLCRHVLRVVDMLKAGAVLWLMVGLMCRSLCGLTPTMVAAAQHQGRRHGLQGQSQGKGPDQGLEPVEGQQATHRRQCSAGQASTGTGTRAATLDVKGRTAA